MTNERGFIVNRIEMKIDGINYSGPPSILKQLDKGREAYNKVLHGIADRMNRNTLRRKPR